MKTKKETFLNFMDLVIDVTDPEYQEMMQGIKAYYLVHGSLSTKQKAIVENAVKFRMLNV